MMNDKLLYDLLYNFIGKKVNETSVDSAEYEAKKLYMLKHPNEVWLSFSNYINKSEWKGECEEILFLIMNIIKEIDRKDKLKCQYCRIDAGLFVQSPVEPHHLCKIHRQDYEVLYDDRTLRQNHPAISNVIAFIGENGKVLEG